MKYKLVGWLDIFFGVLGAVHQLIMLFAVYPKLNTLYLEFGTDLPVSTKIFPYLSVTAVLFFIGLAYLGKQLVFSKVKSERPFNIGLIGLILFLIFGGVYIGFSVISVITPIYSLTTNL